MEGIILGIADDLAHNREEDEADNKKLEEIKNAEARKRSNERTFEISYKTKAERGVPEWKDESKKKYDWASEEPVSHFSDDSSDDDDGSVQAVRGDSEERSASPRGRRGESRRRSL